MSKTAAAIGLPDVRVDCDGRFIKWSEYGKLSEFGWEIDHIHATILGGPDTPDNTRARHWRGNRSAGGILGGLLGNGSR